MRRLGILLAAGVVLGLTATEPRAAECPAPIMLPEEGPRVWFAHEREYVPPAPAVPYGATLPVRTLVTADIAVMAPDGVAPEGFNFTIDFHQERQDIREWMTQHIWPGRLHPGKRHRVGVWQQRTFPGVNVIDIHTNIVNTGRDRATPDYRLCWIGA